MFEKFNEEYLETAHAAYGGVLYLKLHSYTLKDIKNLPEGIKKVPDAVLSRKGYKNYFSFKNEESGFCACLFENTKTKKLIAAYRGTERTGLGENISDPAVWGKDIAADINLITNNIDKQVYDAFEFFECVRKENPSAKIILTGHSLGGALAQLAAAKAYCSTDRLFKKLKIETYTYNAPGCRHLLKQFGCSENVNYKFIKNYSVMNDWCGMYGTQTGESYLLPPLPIEPAASNLPYDIISNVLLNTHEGIFEYSEKINGSPKKKPDGFNQAEGLSLWYYDKNNPVKTVKTIQEFFDSRLPKFNTAPADKILKDINLSEKIPEPLKETLRKIADAHENMKEKILENFNYEVFLSFSKLLEKTMEHVSTESLKRAVIILEDLKMPVIPSYIEDLKSCLK